jgi:hypothetical protein
MARLSEDLVGSWRLLSREDRTPSGELRIDPSLGPDPVAFVVFDAAGYFTAQFMKRDRSGDAPVESRSASRNNTAAIGGYDAYFGTYVVDDEDGVVTQRFLGALSPEDVGKEVTRRLRVVDDRLTVEVDTTSADGEPVTRTLVWERVAT